MMLVKKITKIKMDKSVFLQKGYDMLHLERTEACVNKMTYELFWVKWSFVNERGSIYIGRMGMSQYLKDFHDQNQVK